MSTLERRDFRKVTHFFEKWYSLTHSKEVLPWEIIVNGEDEVLHSPFRKDGKIRDSIRLPHWAKCAGVTRNVIRRIRPWIRLWVLEIKWEVRSETFIPLLAENTEKSGWQQPLSGSEENTIWGCRTDNCWKSQDRSPWSTTLLGERDQ